MTDDLPPEQKPEQTPDPAPDPAPAEPADGAQGEAAAGRRTMIMIVAAAVVVLAAIGVGIYLIANSGDNDVADPAAPTITDPSQAEPPASDPPLTEPPASKAPTSKGLPPVADENVAAARSAAEQAAAAINARNVAAMRQLSCDPAAVGSAEAFPPQATARLAQNPEVTGDKATAQIELSISGSEPTIVPLPMEKRDGRWCVP